jgi:aspartate/tyrosine/aromatic aminotransferase
MENEIIAFREGCIWGFELLANWDKETGKMVKILSSGRKITVDEFTKEVNDGRWDEVLKNKLSKKVVL